MMAVFPPLFAHFLVRYSDKYSSLRLFAVAKFDCLHLGFFGNSVASILRLICIFVNVKVFHGSG